MKRIVFRVPQLTFGLVICNLWVQLLSTSDSGLIIGADSFSLPSSLPSKMVFYSSSSSSSLKVSHHQVRQQEHYYCQQKQEKQDLESTTSTTAAIVDGQSRSSTRRGWINNQLAVMSTMTIVSGIYTVPQPCTAATSSQDDNQVVVDIVARAAAFDAVRQELQVNGIPYMQQQIENENYDNLLEFTKTYDLVLRKGKMGKAKKFLQSSNEKDLATQYCNNVTFDLIGINRSCRGANNNPDPNRKENAMKYVSELQQDIELFLALEPKI
jgi:hypothetical protein